MNGLVIHVIIIAGLRHGLTSAERAVYPQWSNRSPIVRRVDYPHRSELILLRESGRSAQ